MPRKFIRIFFSKNKYLFAKLFFIVIPRAKGHLFKFKRGINLIGFYAEGMGLGQALRNVAGSLLFANIPFAVREMQFKLTNNVKNLSLQSNLQQSCIYRYNLICFNPDFLYRIPTLLYPKDWIAPYNIGYWFWEMPSFPKSWYYAFQLVDEVWVSSDFTLNSLKNTSISVCKIPFAVEFNIDIKKFSRAYFGLPNDAFIFLYCFDLNSSIWRKNPIGVVNAFKKAFPDQKNDPAVLMIKISNINSNHEQFRNLQEAVNLDPRIILQCNDFDRDQMLGLLNIADCYVSLHRAEGLGLIMAESMYLGKPVIATSYSGNLEFMNAQNSCLVSYDLITISEGQYIESDGQYWAEPNIIEAAECMRKIFSDESYRSSLGKSAALYMRENHSFKKMGESIQKRLEELEARFNYQQTNSYEIEK